MTRTGITGTVEEALEIEEARLGRKLPHSFRQWILANNGLDLHDLHIYPIRDERDTRKTWESLAYNLEHDWAESTARFNPLIFAHLLPFADAGNGDFYCFDYSVNPEHGEWPVVCWSQHSGETRGYAKNFNEFSQKLAAP